MTDREMLDVLEDAKSNGLTLSRLMTLIELAYDITFVDWKAQSGQMSRTRSFTPRGEGA